MALRAIARQRNRLELRTPRGSPWYARSVRKCSEGVSPIQIGGDMAHQCLSRRRMTRRVCAALWCHGRGDSVPGSPLMAALDILVRHRTPPGGVLGRGLPPSQGQESLCQLGRKRGGCTCHSGPRTLVRCERTQRRKEQNRMRQEQVQRAMEAAREACEALNRYARAAKDR
jgi:hypothetical protein